MNLPKDISKLKDTKGNDDIIYSILDKHLNLMDEEAIQKDSIFLKVDDKVKYETYLMYSFRKYKAAEYHYNNVIRFREEDKKSYSNEINKLKELPNSKIPGTKGINKVIKRTSSSNHYIYEISAFLAAIRSCIDFVAIVTSMYLSGMEGISSVTPILKKINNSGFNCSIFECYKRHTDWILLLRKYRDKLIHYLTLTAQSGYEHHIRDEKEKLVIYPVVICTNIRDLPISGFLPDTRKKIFYEDHDILDMQRSEISISRDGKEELQEFEIKYCAPTGYMEVSEFLAEHLEGYKEFFSDIIGAFEQLEFKKVKVGH